MQRNFPAAWLRRHRFLTGTVGLGLLFLLDTLPLQAQDTKGIYSPGLILLKTTTATFGLTLRGGFFDPGSDPSVLMQLPLMGEEIRTSPAALFGTAGTNGPPVDTVLELEHPYAAPGVSEFRIVGLHLKNRTGLTVTYNGGANPELWDVEVCLSTVKQLGGIIQLTRSPGISICGGTFNYSLAVTPRLTFKRQRDNAQRILDPGSTGFITFLANGHWADRKNFFPSLPAGGHLFEVANQFQDAYIDANCDGVFDHDSGGDCLTERLPTLASSDLVLGADCTFNSSSPIPPYFWSLAPYTQGPEQTQTVQAATQ
jgi:hypothetical protein